MHRTAGKRQQVKPWAPQALVHKGHKEGGRWRQPSQTLTRHDATRIGAQHGWLKRAVGCQQLALLEGQVHFIGETPSLQQGCHVGVEVTGRRGSCAGPSLASESQAGGKVHQFTDLRIAIPKPAALGIGAAERAAAGRRCRRAQRLR